MKTSVLSYFVLPTRVQGRLFLCTFLLLLGFAQVGKATDYTWTGANNSAWGNTLNWSPAGIPSSAADNVSFLSGSNPCNLISATIIVGSIRLNGYTGTLTVGSLGNLTVAGASGLEVASGTFVYTSGAGSLSITRIAQIGGTIDVSALNNLSINSLNISGGTFYAPNTAPRLLYVSGDVSVTGGTFTHNNGMVIMHGAGNSTLTVDSSIIFYNLTISKPSSNSVTLSSGNTLNLLFGELNVSAGYFNANLGNINTNTFVQGASTTFNAPSGLMVISSHITINASATFFHNNGTVELYNADATVDMGASSNTFYNLIINKSNSNVVTLNNSITTDGLLTFIDGKVATNAINAKGNVNIYNTFDGGNASLTFNSSSDQTLALAGSGVCKYEGNITINKAGGNLILSDNPNAILRLLGGNFTFTAGKVELQDELIVEGNITGFSNSRYFITTGIGKLTQNYGSPSTKSFPVGTETRYGQIDLSSNGGVISIAYIVNPVIPENTMSGNLVRRSFKEAWRFEGSADIAPSIPIPDFNFSEITNTTDLTIAFLKDGNYWENGNSVNYDGLVLASSAYTMTNGYITFGSTNAAQNSLGTGYPNANHITNYNDPINISVDGNINNTVQITYPYISEAPTVNYAGGGETASQWYKFTPTVDGVQISYSNTSLNNAVVEIFDGIVPKGYFLVNAGETKLLPISVTAYNSHYIRISSITGSTSSTGILNVAPYLSPDICSNAVFLSLNDCNVSFDLEPTYTEDYDGLCSSGNPDGWLSFTPPATTSYTFEYSNTTGDVFIRVLSGSCGGPFSNISGCITNPTNPITTKSVTFTGTAGITYYFQIKSKSTLTTKLKGFACLRQGSTPIGDICSSTLLTTTLQASAITVVINIPFFHVANTMRNNEGREAPSATCEFTSDLDRWTRFNAGTANTVTVEYRNTNKDALISVYQGSPFDDLNQTATFCANSVAGVGTETMTFPVTANTTYYVRVQNITDNSTMNGRLQIYQTAPPVPTDLSVNQVSSTSFGVKWTAIPNIDHYQIEIATNLTNFNTTIICSNLFVLSNAYNTANCTYTFLPNTIYYVRVRAVMGGVASANSAVLTVKTALPPPVMIDPQQGDATQDSFTAKWNLVVGATGYFIDVSEETSEGSTIYELMPAYTNLAVGVVSSFNVTGLDAGRTYKYTVRAANSVGSSSDADPKYITIVPASPTVTVDTPTNDGFNLNFTTSLGTDYCYYYITDGTNAYQGYTNSVNGPHTISGLNANTNYTVSLARGNNFGSAYGLPVTAWTVPNPPATSPATDITSTSFTANWSDSQSNVTYEIDVSDNGFSSVFNTYPVSSGTSYTVTGLSNLSTYTYRVRAIGNGSGLISANSGIETVPALLPTPPNSPNTLIINNVTANTFDASWADGGGGATGYIYEVATDVGFSNIVLFNATTFTNVTPSITGGQTYYFRVKATNGITESGYLTSIAIDTPPVAPTANPSSLVTQTSFTANWNQVVGATSYELDVVDDLNVAIAGSPFSLILTNSKEISAGLAPNTTYHYRVRAVNGAGTSGDSNPITVTTSPNPPAVPTGLIASGITNNGFQANWSTVANADDYSIEVSNVANFSTIIVSIPSTGSATTNYFVSSSSIISATTYYFRVAAGTSGVFSAHSAGVMFNTLTNAPNIAVEPITSTGFTVFWNPVAGATNGYEIDIEEELSGIPVLTAFNVGNVTEYTATGLFANLGYIVRVRALNVDNAPSANSNAPKVFTAPAPPTANIVIPANINTTGFTASWSSVVGATNYRIQVSTENTFTIGVLAGYDDAYTGFVNDYAVTGLVGGTTYYYRVKAIIGFGEPSIETDYSNTVAVLTKPNAPSVDNATLVNNNSFTANWTAPFIGNVDSYRLDVATTPNFLAGEFVGLYNDFSVTGLSQNVIGLTAGNTYYYRVRARNMSGDSDNSNFMQVITTLNPPVASAVTNVQATQFRANWASVAGASSYRLQVATDVAFGVATLVYDQNVSNTLISTTVTGLEEGTLYYYRIRAISAQNTATPYSNIITAITKPVALPANPVGITSFTANWQPVAGVDSVEVSVSTLVDFGSQVSGYPAFVVSANSRNLTGLVTLTDYYYRFRAKKNGVLSPYSNTITLKTLPNAPVLTAPVFGDATAATFTAKWSFIAGANNYYIDVATDAGFTALVASYSNQSTGVVNSFLVVGLAPGTQYHYRVRAANGSAVSASSTPATITTKPSLPTALVTSGIFNSVFTVGWTPPASGGQTGYKINLVEFPSLTPVAGYVDVDIFAGAFSFSFASPYPPVSNTKEYRVLLQAYNAFAITEAVSVNVLLQPTATAATNFTATGFTANWNAITGVNNYFVDVSTGTGATFDANIVTTNFASNTNSAVMMGLTAGTTYYYRVSAQNGSVVSPESNEITALIPTSPTAPTADAATPVSNTSFTANWTAGVGGGAVTSYTLQYSTNNFFSFSTISNIPSTETSKEVFITTSGVYMYRVQAINGTGNSVYSNVMLVAMPPAPQVITTFNHNSFTATWLPYGVPSGIVTFEPQASLDNFNSVLTPNTATSTEATFTGLQPNTLYKFRVRATSVAGTSVYSDEMSVTTQITPPTALAATNVQSTGFIANWSSAFIVSQYQIDVATDSGFTNLVVVSQVVNGSLSSVAINNLNPGTAYYYQVRAQGNIENSNPILVITDPLALPATAVDVTTLNANWQAATAPAPISYNIEVATTATFDAGTIVNTTTGLTNNLLPLTSLNSATDYYYRVRVISNGTPSEYSNVITVKTLPNAPTALAPTSFSTTSFTANWTSVPNVTAYYVEVSTFSNFSSFTTTVFGAVASGVITGVTPLANNPGQIYYYRVKAGIGNIISAESNVIAILPPPLTTAATDIASNNFNANWTPPTGAIATDTYVVDYSTDSNFTTFTTTAPSNIIPANIGSLLPNITYHYRVRCIKNGITTGNSNVISLLTLPAVPTLVPATNISQTKFTARWNLIAGITDYRVQVSNNPVSFNAGILPAYDGSVLISNVDSLVVTGLSAGGNYAYRVMAVNATGNSNPSTQQNIDTPINPPANTTATIATSINVNSFQANWDLLTGTGTMTYRLYVATDAGFVNLLAGYDGTASIAEGTFPTVTNLSPNTIYYYRVRAAEDNVPSLLLSNTIAVTTLPAALTANSATALGYSVAPASTHTFTMNWNAPSGNGVIVNYHVDLSADNFATAPLLTLTNAGNSLVIDKTDFPAITGNTTYYYRVRSENNGGLSANSNVVVVKTVPDAPIANLATLIQGDRFTVNWIPMANISNYSLDVSKEDTFSVIDSLVLSNQTISGVLNYTVLGLEAGKIYYYRMRANNASGASNNSAIITVITKPIANELTSPALSTSFIANWQAVPNVGSYTLQVATANTFHPATLLPAITNLTATSHTVNGLSPLTDYFYRVIAVKGTTLSPPSNFIAVKTAPNTPLAVDVPFGEVTTTANSFRARWKTVTGADNYYLSLYVQNGANFDAVTNYQNVPTGISAIPNETGNDILLVSIVAGANATLQVGKTYGYTVKAGNGTSRSAESNMIQITLPPSLPTNLVVDNLTTNSFRASWGAPASLGQDSYEITLIDLSDMSSVENTTTTLLSYEFIGLESDKEYRVKLKAKGSHAYSGEVATDVLFPKALSVTDITATSFQANWSTLPSATGYQLEVATDNAFTNIVFTDNNIPATEDSFVVTVTSTITTHYYRVKAVNPNAVSAYSNAVEVSIPNAPVISLVANSATHDAFALEWSGVLGANKYYLDVSTDSNFGTYITANGVEYNKYDIDNVLTYTINDLKGGTMHYARLRAQNVGGGISLVSNIVSVLLKPDAPRALEENGIVIDGANSSFTARWEASIGATKYWIEVATNNTFTNFLPTYQNKDAGADTTLLVSPVNNGTTYYYRVWAENATGLSPKSEGIEVVIPVDDPDKPIVPSNLDLFATSSTEVTVRWQDNSDNETGFEIQRTDTLTNPFVTIKVIASNNNATPQDLTYEDTGLTPLKRYWYRVRAIGASSNSLYTLSKSVVTASDAPDAPDNLFAIADGLTSIYLSWRDNAHGLLRNETGFRIYRGLGEIGAPFAMVAQLPANAVEFIDTGLQPNELYKYYVIAYKNNPSGRTDVAFARTADVPKVPSDVVAQAISKDVINLTWTDNATNEEEFVIEASSVETDDIFEVVKVVDANITSFQFTATDGVKANHLYKFRMFARNDAGRSRYSNSDTTLTKIDNTITPPIAPSGLVAESVSTIEIKLRWQDNSPNEDYFIIERSVGLPNNFTEFLRIGDNITNLSDLDVEEGRIYYYRIMAVNGGGKSALSNTAFTEALCNPIMVLVPDNPSGSGALVCDSKHVELTLNTNVTQGDFYWYRNGELIPNAHLTRYVATETGEYYCRVIAGNCDKSTPIVSVIVNPSFSVGVNFDNTTSLLVANYTGADKYQWYFNYSPIQGATEQTYKPTALGMYYVVITEGACSATSNPYPLTNVTAVENWDISSQINVFPNPAKAQEAKITIDNSLLGEVEIRLIDQYGKVHQSIKTRKDAHAWQYKMDLNKMSTGLYIIDVRFGKYAGKRKLSIVE